MVEEKNDKFSQENWDKIEREEKEAMKPGPTKEQIATVEKSLVLFLIDLKKTMDGAKVIVNRIGFTHLGNSLNCVITDIDIYLEEYKKGKVKK